MKHSEDQELVGEPSITTRFTDAVIEQMSGIPDPRLKQIMRSLVRYLYEFAREVDLASQKWLEGVTFLTAVGQKCLPSCIARRSCNALINEPKPNVSLRSGEAAHIQ